jgi:flavin-dependent thymidylate synthase
MPLTPDQRDDIDRLRATTVPTRRATVPAVEEILYEPIPVLDHGFVRVIDYMGDDAAVVQAARVSYGKGTRKVNEDAGLIRYLMRHWHSTPFEMCEIKFHVKLPIFVARQWIRHRTACLAGNSVLYFDLPGGRAEGGKFRRHNVSIEKFFDMWHNGTVQTRIAKRKPAFAERIDPDRIYTVPELAALVERREESIRNLIRQAGLQAIRVPVSDPRQSALHIKGQAWLDWAAQPKEQRFPIRDRLRRMQIRMCNEETGEIQHTTITDIWQSGEKPVYRVTLDNGYSLEMTKDHRCLTSEGWMTLERAADLRLRPDHSVSSWRKGSLFAANGVPAYQNPEWLQSKIAECLTHEEIGLLCDVSKHTIKKWADNHGIRYTKEQFGKISSRRQMGRTVAKKPRGPLSGQALERIRMARSGPASNFWKGGVSREAFSRNYEIVLWNRRAAPKVHADNGFQCVICGGKRKLHAHHVDPIWNNPDRAMDESNLTSLCQQCHSALHAGNLEMALKSDSDQHIGLAGFFGRHAPEVRPFKKPLPEPQRLVRTFVGVKSIEYVGVKMTYDLSVAGPFHNFVANGLIVHNSVNEYSARYSVMDKEFYVPAPEHLSAQSMVNRQGRGAVLEGEEAAHVLAVLREDAERNYRNYAEMLNQDEEGAALDPNRSGLARELARMNLTLNVYTQWYWKIDLHNLMHFLRLRADAHAQYEIRAYADAMMDVLQRWVPLTAEAFREYRVGGTHLSATGLAVVRRMLTGEAVTQEASGLSKREWRELMEQLGRSESA